MLFHDEKSHEIFRLSNDCRYDFYLKMEYRLKTEDFLDYLLCYYLHDQWYKFRSGNGGTDTVLTTAMVQEGFSYIFIIYLCNKITI